MPPVRTSSSPIRSAARSQNRVIARLSGEADSSRISTPASTFSQMRGTPNRIVGCTSRRLAWTVSMDSAKFTCTPAAALNQTVKARSATWHRGRYDSARSLSDGGGEAKPPPSTSRWIAYSTLPTVSITPLGGPVVPEV
nr:hypothetical protein GCM10020093_038090 [Planobispora longispora]